MCHRALLISVVPYLLFFIAVHQEDGIIQRDSKLQHRRQRFRNIRYLSKEIIASQVIKDRHSDTKQEQNRYEKGIHRDPQDQYRQDDRGHDIKRSLLLGKILRIRHDRRHPA